MVNFMRAAVNEQRKYKGLPALTASEFLKLMREKRDVVELDNKLANRSVNEGFSLSLIHIFSGKTVSQFYVVDSFISLYFVSLALETEGHIQKNDNNGKDSKSHR